MRVGVRPARRSRSLKSCLGGARVNAGKVAERMAQRHHRTERSSRQVLPEAVRWLGKHTSVWKCSVRYPAFDLKRGTARFVAGSVQPLARCSPRATDCGNKDERCSPLRGYSGTVGTTLQAKELQRPIPYYQNLLSCCGCFAVGSPESMPLATCGASWAVTPSWRRSAALSSCEAARRRQIRRGVRQRAHLACAHESETGTPGAWDTFNKLS